MTPGAKTKDTSKLILGMVIITTIVLGAFVAFRTAIIEQQHRTDLEQRAEIIALRVASTVTPSIWNIFEKSVDRVYTADVAAAVLDAELMDPVVLAIIVDGNFGHVFMGKIRTMDGEIVSYDASLHKPLLDDASYQIRRPITYRTMSIGSVQIYLTAHDFHSSAADRLLYDLLEIAVVVLVLGIGMIFVINRTLLEPNRAMAIAQQAFESLNDALFVTDPKGRIIDANSAFLRASNLPEESILAGRPPLTISDRTTADKLSQIWQGKGDLSFWSGEVEITRPDGTHLPVLMSVAPVQDHGQDTGYKVTLFRDMSEQKETEHRLQRLLEEASRLGALAEQSSNSKSEFLATMSHELRTPLNAIIGFTEMLLLKSLSLSEEKTDEYHHSILSSSRHLLNLINDILDLAKVDAGKVEVVPEDIQLHHLVEECTLFLEPALQNKQIELVPHLSPVAVTTDPRLMKQILINLLSNAVKFSPAGGKIELNMKLRSRTEVEILVKDHGQGMTDSELETAMEPFVQLENSYRRTQEGTGLGLPLVVRFAQLIGARFAIDSAKGTGTTAQLLVPCKPQAEACVRETVSAG
ncbi:PAS domain-containing sensor histidine kinase [Rhodovibrionaceae bacterium A322]